MADIGKIDEKLAVKKSINKDDIKFYDVREEPFKIYGLYNPVTEPKFLRMPADIAYSVGSNQNTHNVGVLTYHTAGGRVRFSTDSDYVAIRCHMDSVVLMTHMTLAGSAGFDLYMDDEGEGVFCGNFEPPTDMTHGYESIKEFRFSERKMRNYTIYFPLYNDVTELFVGLQKNAKVGPGKPYKYETPVVIYGSSITQGGCVCRPGNCYSNIISRKYDVDTLNLGFSGSAKGEPEMIEYIAGLDMSIFVCDYDHNSPDPEHLAITHPNVYRGIREKHPDLPIIFVSKPCFERPSKGTDEAVRRREVIFKTYTDAYNAGDRNVYFVDGESIFGPEDVDACTVDLYHPNDLGHLRMAKAIGYRIGKILRGSRYGSKI